jgi:hypothetical protein
MPSLAVVETRRRVRLEFIEHRMVSGTQMTQIDGIDADPEEAVHVSPLPVERAAFRWRQELSTK